MAAVRPAGPDPTMMTSRGSMYRPCCSSRGALRPAEPAEHDADSAERQPDGPHLALIEQHEAAEEADHEQEDGRHRDERGQQAEHDRARDRACWGNRLVADRADDTFDRVGRVGGPVGHATPGPGFVGAYPRRPSGGEL